MNSKECVRKRSWPILRQYPSIFLEGMSTTLNIFSRDNHFLGRNSNPRPSENEKRCKQPTATFRLMRCLMNCAVRLRNIKCRERMLKTGVSSPCLPPAAVRKVDNSHSYTCVTSCQWLAHMSKGEDHERGNYPGSPRQGSMTVRWLWAGCSGFDSCREHVDQILGILPVRSCRLEHFILKEWHPALSLWRLMWWRFSCAKNTPKGI